MSACNRFGESIVHLACRRSSTAIVEFLIQHGGDVTEVDDYGRSALHDACWRAEPRFDIVALIMDVNPELIRCCDRRGATPLQYVRKEHWVYWCAFLFFQKDKYWPWKKTEEMATATSTVTSAVDEAQTHAQIESEATISMLSEGT